LDFFGHIDIPRFVSLMDLGIASPFLGVMGRYLAIDVGRIGRDSCSYPLLIPTPLRFRSHEVDVNISLSNLNELSSLGIQFSVLGFQ